MSIIIVLTLGLLVWHGAMATARVMVDAAATAMGLILFARADRLHRRILALRDERGSFDFDRRPSRAERRLMAAGLKLAIRQTELRSLFSQVAARCERLLGMAPSSL